MNSTVRLFFYITSFLSIVGQVIAMEHTTIAPDLPKEIQMILPGIVTYRIGCMPDSNMITTSVHAYVDPSKVYSFTGTSLHAVEGESPVPTVEQCHRPVKPPYVEITGRWTAEISHTRQEANILGGSGTFILASQSPVRIPSLDASQETLAYYNAMLVESGDYLKFTSPQLLPVCTVHTGKNYPVGYLGRADYGGGFYLEVHETPHFWAHLKEHEGGAVILGKKVAENTYHLSAFRIPFGKAVYAPGGVIHNDGFLQGDILVIYTATEQYSTVVVKDQAGDLVDFEVAP